MNSRAGFTLFEVIIVAAVLSIGLLMIVQVFPLGLQAKEAAEQYSTATLLGQRMMEEIRRKGYDDLNAAYTSEVDGYGVGEGKFEEHKGYRYRLEWWDTKTPYLREVKVRILYGGRRMNEDNDEYEDDESGWQCLELVTYLAKRN